mgnify:CR=1 FL=1
MEGLDLPPVLDLKRVQHLANVERLFLQLAVGREDIANSCHFHDELVLKRFQAEVWDLNSISNHLVNVEKVVVCLPEICKGNESFSLNGSQLLIGLLLVVNVHFVPLFERLDGVLAPRDVGVHCEALHIAGVERQLPERTHRLLAVEVVDIGGV